eukprot:gene20880-biopygen2615
MVTRPRYRHSLRRAWQVGGDGSGAARVPTRATASPRLAATTSHPPYVWGWGPSCTAPKKRPRPRPGLYVWGWGPSCTAPPCSAGA